LRTSRSYNVHGFTVESDLALNAPLDDRATAAEVHVTCAGEGAIPGEPPAGRLAALIDDPPYRFFLAELDDAFVLRYQGACDCRVDAGGRRMEVTIDARSDAELAATIVGSGALAFVAMRRGAAIFHASAVMLGEVGVVVLGDAGSGKSTTAAELCLAGASLLADDAARMGVDGDGARVWRSASALRLRATAATALAAEHPGLDLAATSEGRVLLRREPGPPGGIPVAAVLVPQVDDRRRELCVEPIAIRDAMIAASQRPRISGFLDGRHLRAHFALSGELADRVPFFAYRRPPFVVRPDAAMSRVTALLSR
jgi:hypothetical protein